MIRDAELKDLSAIVAIYNAAIPGRMATADLVPVSLESRRTWFADHDPQARPLWVEENAGQIRGWLSFQSFHGRPAYQATAEVSIYIAPELHRKGLGRQMLVTAIERSPAMGILTLLGFIFGHNESSLRLFRSAGFATWGHLPEVAELDGVKRDLMIFGRRV